MPLLIAIFSLASFVAAIQYSLIEHISIASVIGIGSFFLGFFRPGFAILVFIFLLPVFGNRPGSSQALLLSLYATLSILGISFSKKNKPTVSFKSFIYTPLGIVSSLYVLISILSLNFRLLLDVAEEGSQIVLASNNFFQAIKHFSLWSYMIISENEASRYYAITSVFHTLLSYSFSILVYQELKRGSLRSRSCLQALLFGLITTLLLGLINYYVPFGLNDFRSLDPLVNPGGVEFRLQSFFGHSGWFAEFVTLAMPSVVVILLFEFRYSLKVFLIILTLLIGEFCLILSYQRGAWLSYPITLLVVWGAIYAFRHSELGIGSFFKAFKSSLLKVLVSIPITLVLSAGLIWVFANFEIISGREFHGLSSYGSRFKEIANTNDRTQFFKAGFKIGMLHPIMGAGSETFSSEFEDEFMIPSGRYYKEIELPLHGSAHNVFMQTFAGKGFVGLGALLCILLLLITTGRKVLLSKKQDRDKLVVVLFGNCFSSAFLIYGNVQEIFYVQSLQYLFFIVVAIVAGSFNDKRSSFIWRRYQKVILGVVGALFIFHQVYEYSYNKAYHRGTFGCYAKEIVSSDSADSHFRWCAPKARIFSETGIVSISLPILNQETARIVIKVRNAERDYVYQLKAGEKLQVDLGEAGRGSFIDILVDSVFVNPGDPRVLSFQVLN